MLMVFLKTILGLILLAAGIGMGYYYLSNIDNGASALLLIPALCIPAAGIYLLLKAGKSDATIILKPKGLTEAVKDVTDKDGPNLIEKNNAISEAWAKSVEKRDKMKIIEMAASAEEKKSFEHGY